MSIGGIGLGFWWWIDGIVLNRWVMMFVFVLIVVLVVVLLYLVWLIVVCILVVVKVVIVFKLCVCFGVIVIILRVELLVLMRWFMDIGFGLYSSLMVWVFFCDLVKNGFFKWMLVILLRLISWWSCLICVMMLLIVVVIVDVKRVVDFWLWW